VWHYNGQLIEQLPDDIIGFVYLIINKSTGKKYIGKKLAKFTKTKVKTVTLKSGEKKKKKMKTYEESDWKTYWSSSEELKKDVASLGEESFTREILHYCNSKGVLSYMELKEQMARQVLESTDYYNAIVQVKIHKNHVFGKIL
jgi:mannosyltransferase OCH1-like enzyme